MLGFYQSVYLRQVREGRSLEQKTGKSASPENGPGWTAVHALGLVEKTIPWTLLPPYHSELLLGEGNLGLLLSKPSSGKPGRKSPLFTAECTPQRSGTRERTEGDFSKSTLLVVMLNYVYSYLTLYLRTSYLIFFL